MTEQTEQLFPEEEAAGFGPKARASDPATSHAAADAILNTRASSQRGRLWGAFRAAAADNASYWRRGMTDEEAAGHAGVSLTSEYATRCSELRNAGLIETTGETRAGASGLQRDVSRITERGATLWREKVSDDVAA